MEVAAVVLLVPVADKCHVCYAIRDVYVACIYAAQCYRSFLQLYQHSRTLAVPAVCTH